MSVPSSLSQFSSLFSDLSHKAARVAGSGHVRTCVLSLSGAGHLGYCAKDWNCHLCMFLPVAKWLETYFATQHWQCKGIPPLCSQLTPSQYCSKFLVSDCNI